MQIWVDVEDAAGTRYGDGPIITASEWESTRRMDAAGTFSFSMPASDSRSNLLANKRIVRCWAADDHGIREVGSGIIDLIEIVPNATGPTMLRVSGDDLLRELANRTVGDLELHQEVEYSTVSVVPLVLRYQTYTSGSNLTLPATIDLSNDPMSFLYVQYPRTFSRITFTLSSANGVVSDTFQVQYYNATNPSKPAWEDLPGLVNNTARAAAGSAIYPFGRTGTHTIEFDPPPGWSKLGDVYIIRFFDQGKNLGSFRVTSASVTIVEPVSDGLQRIMGLAPDAWTLDPAGNFATGQQVFMQFQGESVLSALVMLAGQTGEHFTLSPAARRLWWLGSTQDASGLRAISAADQVDNTLLITALTISRESYDLYTRAYGFGGGLGSGRLTMAGTTRNNSGYTLAADGSYLEADAAIATYGRIDYRDEHPDVVPVDQTQTQMVNAANALYDRVYQNLRRKCQLQYAYQLTVVPTKYEVWPGQTVRVDYHEWVDSHHAVNINTDLLVLETVQRITAQGVQTVGLTVATVDMWGNNDYRAVARMMGMAQTDRASEPPARGYTSVGPGVPVVLAVNNGQVTAVHRVQPADDGWYRFDEFWRFRLQSGIITYLESV